jgi:methionyl-tRNA formyltransferase
MNGEKETGVTTFFLQHEIDTGKILFSERTAISENETAGEVHDRLMHIGANLVLKTVKAIQANDFTEHDQSEFYLNEKELRHAPKIFKEDCRINWEKSLEEIHDQVRGLSPYPAAFTELCGPDGKQHTLKIFRTEKEISSNFQKGGNILTDGKTYLKVSFPEGFLQIRELQLAGKKRMSIEEFLRGFPLNGDWKVL